MEEGDNFEGTSLNETWLKNIYEQLKKTQEMELNAKEGCKDLMESLSIPYEARAIVCPETQYKNLRFLTIELNSIIINLAPVLKGKEDSFRKKLEPVLGKIYDYYYFLKPKRINDKINYIEVLPSLMITVNYLINLKADLIKEIAPILYIKNDDKKKDW